MQGKGKKKTQEITQPQKCAKGQDRKCRIRQQHATYAGPGAGAASDPAAAAAATTCLRWHSDTKADRSPGRCCRNEATSGWAPGGKRSGKRSRAEAYNGHSKRTWCTPSNPPWQWGHTRCSLGTLAHRPVSSPSQCDPVRSWANATLRARCRTALMYAAGALQQCTVLFGRREFAGFVGDGLKAVALVLG